MQLVIDDSDLKTLVEQVVGQALSRAQSLRNGTTERLGYTEPEAASLLGIKPHVLRDSRLRGEVHATRVGKKMLYSRAELERLLMTDSVGKQ